MDIGTASHKPLFVEGEPPFALTAHGAATEPRATPPRRPRGDAGDAAAPSPRVRAAPIARPEVPRPTCRLVAGPRVADGPALAFAVPPGLRRAGPRPSRGVAFCPRMALAVAALATEVPVEAGAGPPALRREALETPGGPRARAAPALLKRTAVGGPVRTVAARTVTVGVQTGAGRRARREGAPATRPGAAPQVARRFLDAPTPVVAEAVAAGANVAVPGPIVVVERAQTPRQVRGAIARAPGAVRVIVAQRVRQARAP